jgi:hypothetical protein
MLNIFRKLRTDFEALSESMYEIKMEQCTPPELYTNFDK